MSMPFELTHEIYDLLYGDKDYAGEAAFVESLLRRLDPDCKDVLELGCGSGRHALHLAKAGYSVTGVDRSQGMLDKAVERASGTGTALRFLHADIRSLRLGRRFGAVISLFHVMSYVTTNADVLRVLRGVREHLRPGGVFLFDFWYGPAVLAQRPSARSRELAGEGVACTRTVRPSLRPNRNVVDVEISLDGFRLPGGEPVHAVENHAMRYFFLPELALFAQAAGFRLEKSMPFGGKGRLGLGSWNALVVLRRVETGARKGE